MNCIYEETRPEIDKLGDWSKVKQMCSYYVANEDPIICPNDQCKHVWNNSTKYVWRPKTCRSKTRKSALVKESIIRKAIEKL